MSALSSVPDSISLVTLPIAIVRPVVTHQHWSRQSCVEHTFISQRESTQRLSVFESLNANWRSCLYQSDNFLACGIGR